MKRAIVIGRFAPCHLKHLELFRAATDYDSVIILLGSSERALTCKDPFTSQERQKMILMSCSAFDIKIDYFSFFPIKDFPEDDNKWVCQIHDIVDGLDKCETHLIGANKDASSFYLKLFPDWSLKLRPVTSSLSATDVRKALFESDYAFLDHCIVSEVKEYLTEHSFGWINTDTGRALREEYLTSRRLNE